MSYDPRTGLWANLKTRGNRIAGSKVHKGLQIGIDGKKYKKSRLAWFYMTNTWPPDQIDHINCDIYDNRWVNLRPANGSENCGNRRRHVTNRSGFKSVRKNGRRWEARVMKNGKPHHLGFFACPIEAAQAYEANALKLFGQFARIE